MTFVLNLNQYLGLINITALSKRIAETLKSELGIECIVTHTDINTELAKAKAENLQLRAQLDNRSCDLQQMLNWLDSPAIARQMFSPGPEMELALAVEDILYSHQQTSDVTEVLNDPLSRDIFKEVMQALQNAEEIGGPEGTEYVKLMGVLSSITRRRMQTCKDILASENFEKAA